MIGQTTLALKLKLQEILTKFQQEQQNRYSLLNQNHQEIDAKKKELAALLATKRQLESQASPEEIKKRHLIALQQLIAMKEPQLETLKKGSEAFDEFLEEYAKELSALNNQLQQNLLRMQSEEAELRALIATETQLMEAIQRIVAFQSTLMSQCLEKLQKTKADIIVFLRENFSDNPILAEQLTSLEQGVSVRPEVSPELTETEHLLRAAKRSFVLGVKQLDDLVGEMPEQQQNTMLGSLNAPFFASPVKYAKESDKTTAIKSIAFYVPTVKVELPYLRSLEEEKARGEALQKQLQEMQQRLDALQSTQRQIEEQNATLNTTSAAQAIELSETKAVLEQKSAELLGTVARFQTLETDNLQLKEKHSKLETACEVLTENYATLKKSAAEKEALLEKKEKVITTMSARVTRLDQEKHKTEADLKRTLLGLIAEKETLAKEKEDLAGKLRQQEEELLAAQAEKKQIEGALALEEEEKTNDVADLQRRLLLLSLPSSPSSGSNKEMPAGGPRAPTNKK